MESPHERGAGQRTQAVAVTTLQGTTLSTTATTNVGSPLLTITRDKLELRASKFFRLMMRRYGWVPPLSTMVPLILALETTQFHDAGLKADQWQILFLVATIGVAVWLVVSIIIAFFGKGINDFLEDCMREEQ